MSGFKISKKTRTWQRITNKEVEKYKDKVLLHLSHNKTRLMTVMDIAREVANDYEDETEVARVARVVRNMENQGLISRSGGKVKSYWSKVTKRTIQPTYVPPTPVEEEDDETEEQSQETQTETPEDKPVAETEKVNVPVQTTRVIQDVIPVQRPIEVNRTPRRITITIDI